MSCSCSSSAVKIIGHNEYLVTQILAYLPVKTILRFQSVSKQWHSLLNHPKFRTKNRMLFFQQDWSSVIGYIHLQRSEDNVDIADFNYLQYPRHDNLYLESSCSGLLLLRSVNFKVREKCYRFYVCNPSTRNHSELVLPKFLTKISIHVSAHLVFDLCTSPHYKVIFFRTCNDRLFISIYSSETKTLSKTVYTLDKEGMPWLHKVVLFNGLICWTDRASLSEANLYNFDINDQKSIKVFPKPPNINGGKDYSIMYFGKFGGHLKMILHDETKPLQGVLNVYELKKNCSSWVTKHKVHIESITVDFLHVSTGFEDYKYSFVCIVENEEDEEADLVISVGDHQLISHNLKDNTTEKLCDLPPWVVHLSRPRHRVTATSSAYLTWNKARFECIRESLYGV